MSTDPALAMKQRLRADLTAVMKARRADEAKVLRALIAALDNAEAPPLPPGGRASDQASFRDGSAEIERLSLDAVQVRAIISADIEDRTRSADELSRVGQADRAAALRAEAELARRYLD